MKLTVHKSGDLVGVARQLERAARDAQRTAGKAVAVESRKVILDDVRRARGSLRMMTGRLGVTVSVDATAVNSDVELRARPAGPWAIVESGTKAHEIRPRRRDVLAVDRGDVIGMSANVRGVTGGRYWTRATDRLDVELAPIVERIVDREMNEA